MRNRIAMFAIILVACFGFLPAAHPVVPPPDGGYPGGNTAEGQTALLSLTTGGFNTAIGFLSLRSDTTGAFNTAIGAGTLLANTADEITAIGAGALLSNTTGVNNTAIGAFALFSNATGGFNTATGVQALFSNTEGGSNTANGFGTLSSNTIGVANTANGTAALSGNTSGNNNSAFGSSALQLNHTGNSNTAVGEGALFSNNGDDNTAIGEHALANNVAGLNNTACGEGALSANTTGSGNIALGIGAGFNVTTANSVICIGADGQNVSNSCYIGNIFGATSSGGAAVLVNSSGKLGTMTSSRRFKEEIKPMDQASEALFALKPVTFRYKKEIDPAGMHQFGLVAEEVEKVNPDLVVRDKEGKPYSVRYEQVNAMLLNEFLKEHLKNEEQEATIARQQKQIEALTAGLQKVSAQLEANKSAPQTVSNDQ